MKKNNDIISFSLRKINTEQFAIIENAFKENETINLQAGIDFKINVENKLIGCFTRFQFQINNTPFLILNVKCEFIIKEASWNEFIDKEKKLVNLSKALISHLAVISVGTSRGVLHAKTENTKFNSFFLPTVNVNEFVKEDLSFPINE